MAEAGADRVPDLASAVAAEKGRVLLLEDDPSFKEVVRDFLLESGYTVVTVQNGGEGVREVLAGDFALVLCDMAMPSVSGDVFYRAVERIRPPLCERFVFMTGYRNNTKANEFIESVSGLVLHKPFHLKDLLDALVATETRIGLQEALEAASIDPALFRARPTVDPIPAAAAPNPPAPEVAPEVSEPLPSRQVAPVPQRPAPVFKASGPEPRADGASSQFTFAGIAFFLIVAVLLGVRYPDARDRAEATAAERLALEAEWRTVSAQTEQADTARGSDVLREERVQQVAEERRAGGWTEALRAISIAAGEEIELRSVTARSTEQFSGTRELRIEGVAIGRTPRLIAEGFHQTLGRELERSFRSAILAQFEKFEDEPEPSSAPPDGRRASFAFTVKVGSGKPATTVGGLTQ